MAAFTSIATGNWNDGPTTWGTGAGVYPGSVGAQPDSVTIATGHVVSLNVTTLAGTVTTVVLNGSAKLTVDAQFNTDAKFTGNWTFNNTSELEFGKGSGTYELRTQGQMNFNSGTTLDMDASAAGCKQILSCDAASAAQNWLGCASGSVAILQGRTKTGSTQLNGALTLDVTTELHIDNDTGWESGDSILIVSKYGAATQEVIVLGTKTLDHWSFTGGGAGGNTPVNSYPDNTQAWNLTRSCVVQSSDAANDAQVIFYAGLTTLTCAYVEFVNVYQVEFSAASKTISNSVVRGQVIAARTGFGMLGVGSTLSDCIVYKTLSGSGMDLAAAHVSAIDCRISAQSGLQYYNYPGLWVSGLYATCSGTIVTQSYPGVALLANSYLWGGTIGLYYSADGVRASGCVFGTDPGGNVLANTTDVSHYAGEVRLDDCVFSVVSINQASARIISTNHGGVSGVRKEWQKYGLCTAIVTAPHAGTYHDSAVPSSTTIPYRYTIIFPVASGKTPTLTLWMRVATGVTSGVIAVLLGSARAGLTAIATGTPITVSETYAQKTITFTGTTDCAGQVEVWFDILKDASATAVYIDDIAVSGNL